MVTGLVPWAAPLYSYSRGEPATSVVGEVTSEHITASSTETSDRFPVALVELDQPVVGQI